MAKPNSPRMSKPKTGFGCFLRRCRLRVGVSQGEVALAIGMTQTGIGSIERGKHKYLEAQYVGPLADVLRVDVETIVGAGALRPRITELGRLIQKRRVDLRLSHEEFSKKIGRSITRTRHIETSPKKTVGPALAARIAQGLELPYREMLPFVTEPRSVVRGKLGDFVRKHRRARALTMRKLASKVGVSAAFIGQIEDGRAKLNQERSEGLLIRMAEILQVPAEEILACREGRKSHVRKAA